LAAGRPVVLQDTGFSSLLPVGEGLFSFKSADEAAYAIGQVEANYPRQSDAATQLAEQYFASDKVLTALIEKAMNGDG
jgi:hypothetical protein